MNFQTMHQQRKFVLIAAAVGVISMFLPWLTYGYGGYGVSVNAMHGMGIVAFLGYGASIAFALLKDHTKQMEVNFWILTLFSGALAFLITLIAILQIAGHFSIGFGAFISLAASGTLVFFTWKYKQPQDTIQAGFDSLFKGGGQTVQAAQPQAKTNSRMEELDKLVQMRNEGKISEEEYQDLKSKIL